MEPSGFGRSSIIEIDDIQFEGIIGNALVKIPSKQPDAKTDVEFGIRITNRGKSLINFLFFFLMPSFSRVDGKKVSFYGCNANGIWFPEESDIQLLAPGESKTFLVKGAFVWRESQLIFTYLAKDGSYCSFGDFEPEVYQMNINYNAPSLHLSNPPKILSNIQGTENVWEGRVTPSIYFRLIDELIK